MTDSPLEYVSEHLRRRGDDGRRQLVLSVAFLPREGAETRLPYQVELNGASILSGLLRAKVAHMIALGPYGPMLLPAVNLIEGFRARSREAAEKTAGVEGRAAKASSRRDT